MNRALRSTSHAYDVKPSSLYVSSLPESDSPALEGSIETVETYGEHEDSNEQDNDKQSSEDYIDEADGEPMKRSPHHLVAQDRITPKFAPTLQVIHRLLVSNVTDKEVRTSVPQRTMANASFVIYIPPNSSWKNLLADGLGPWKASKGPTTFFVRKDTDDELVVATAITRDQYSAETETYYFQRRTFINQSCQQYHRTIITSADQRCQFGYLQYYFRDSVEHEFELITPTVNRSAGRIRYAAFPPNGSGKKQKVSGNEIAVSSLPKFEEFPATISQLPTDCQPCIVSSKSLVLPDSLEEVIAKCNQEVKTSDIFILEVIAAPEPKIFLSNRRQLNDIRRFCTQPDNFGILCKDILTNAGESGYCVTFTVYEHLMVKGKDGRHPCVLGPMYVHREMDFYTGYEFAVSLIKYEMAAQNLTAFGPSSDVQLDRAFQMVFPNAKRYLPPAEIQQLVSNKLDELEIKDQDAETITQGVYGLLMDTVPMNELEEHVYMLMDTWQSLHQNGTEFGQYFLNNILVQLRNNLELKKRSGGSTPDVYAQQVSSQMKAFIKKCCTKKCSLPELIRKLREIVWKQEKDLEGAIVGKADLKLEPPYRELYCNESDFFNASKTPMSQRRIILNRIHEQELV